MSVLQSLVTLLLTMKNRLQITVVQADAGVDRDANLAAAEIALADCPSSDVIAFPEMFALRSSDADYRTQAEPFPGPLLERLSSWAKAKSTWILAGSMLERVDQEIYNTSVLFDPSGKCAARYRKIHLFDLEAQGDSSRISESDVFTPGNAPMIADINGWHCGLSICYDLRFPELYRSYSHQGAQILFVPSNFTHETGQAHWETLLRARAIENQCYVVAPNQCGTNQATAVQSYGHSMIIDPWGHILKQAEGLPCQLTATVDADVLRTVRERLPALGHSKLDR